MNKELFIALCDHIEAEVNEIKFIDFDEGQLNTSERPPVAFPCCLIDINYPACQDLDDKTQLVTANITLKLAFCPEGETHNHTPKRVRDKALKSFDVIEKLQTAMQGEELDGLVSAISRSRAAKTVLRNKVIVYTISYSTTFQEVLEESVPTP